MGEKGVGKLSRETPPPREGEPMGSSFGASMLPQHCLRRISVIGGNVTCCLLSPEGELIVNAQIVLGCSGFPFS